MTAHVKSKVWIYHYSVSHPRYKRFYKRSTMDLSYLGWSEEDFERLDDSGEMNSSRSAWLN